MAESPSVHITDEDRAARWRALREQYDGTQSDLLREIIDEACDRRLDDGVASPDDLEDAAGDDEEESIIDQYDPETYDDRLSTDDLRELSGEAAEIDPADVGWGDVPQGEAIPLVTAMARYEYDRVNREDVEDMCQRVGLVSDYYLTSKSNGLDVPGRVVERLGGEGKHDEQVVTSESVTEVLEQAATTSLLRYDLGDEEVALRALASEQRDALQSADGVEDVVGAAQTIDVLGWALWRLAEDGTGCVLDSLGYDGERLEGVDWPRDADGLVDRYVEARDPGWADSNHLCGHVAEEIREFADEE